MANNGASFSDEDENTEVNHVWEKIQQKRFGEVTKLPFQGSNLDNSQLQSVIELLEFTDCKLEMLDLSFNMIGPEQAGLLGPAFTKNVSITFLDLSCNQIGDEGIKSIASSFEMRESNYSAVKELNLRDCNISPAGVQTLSAALSGNSSMELLNLSGNVVGDQGATALASVINGGVGSTALTYLVLANSQIGVLGGQALGQAIAVGNKPLVGINLSGNPIGDEGALEVANGMTACPTLEEVYLGGCGLGNEAAGAIGAAVKQCRNLTRLGLFCNFIQDDGVVIIFRALEENRNLRLRELLLHDNTIGTKGAVRIGAALGSNISLTLLNLAGNQFDEEATKLIADGLGTNQQLLELNLSRCQLNDKCAELLAAVIDQENRTLGALLLDNNLFSKKTKYEVEYAMSRQRKGVKEILNALTESQPEPDDTAMTLQDHGLSVPVAELPLPSSPQSPLDPVNPLPKLGGSPKSHQVISTMTPTDQQKVTVSIGRQTNVIGHIFATVRTTLKDARENIKELGVNEDYVFLNQEGNAVLKEDEENRLVLLDCGMSVNLRPSGWLHIPL